MPENSLRLIAAVADRGGSGRSEKAMTGVLYALTASTTLGISVINSI